MIDPIDAVKMTEDGVCGLMQMPADVLVDTLFEFQGEPVWFWAMHVLWGQSVVEYDDDDVLGVRCTVLGYR